MALRKDKSLGTLAVIVNISEIGADIKSVDASAAKGEPTAIVTPGMVTFAVSRVGSNEGPYFTCLLVAQP